MTGYTSYIENGKVTTGKEFLTLCLRQFGVASDIRDEPLSVPVPRCFEPNKFYKEIYQDATQKLAEFDNLSLDDIKLRMRNENEARVAHAKEMVQNLFDKRERYREIRKQVSAWIPPTEAHNGVKEFALQQISISYPSDDIINYYESVIDAPFDDSDDAILRYREEYLFDLRKEFVRAKKHYDESVAEAKQKTKFMEDFLNSFDDNEVGK